MSNPLTSLPKKEYTYSYEEGRIVRAAEFSITLDANEMVTARTLVNSVLYSYNTEGELTKKRVIPVGGTEQIIHYENPENGNTVVKFTAGGRNVTSHSKTDSFGRKEFDELQLGNSFIARRFRYHEGELHAAHVETDKVKSSPTTNLVSEIVFNDKHSLAYEYDAEERITKVTERLGDIETVTEYTYDGLGQLLTEKVNGVVVNTMTYDNYGNIKSKNGVAYTYGDNKWKDLLTGYGSQAITYDAQGNPTTYLGNTLTWEKGRQLKSFGSNTYTYNANGIRTSKTIGNIRHDFTLDGVKILREEWNGNTLTPLYDNEESVCGVVYNNEPYYFLKNLQGDIIAVTDKNSNTVARYSYDAWGVCTITQDTSGCDIANINPFRYRSYFFDKEIGLYYLQSRYYDPEIGRFLNGDEMTCVIRNTQSEKGNAYSYVFNCPTNKTDESGQFSLKFLAFGIQLAFSYGRISVGLEFLWDLKNGKFYPFIYFGPSGSKDVNGIMGYVSRCFLAPLKKASRSVSALLKVFSKLSVAVSAIIVFGSSNRTMPRSYYGWFNCFSLTFKVCWANVILSGAFARDSSGYIASFGMGLSTDRPLFLKVGYGKAYYIHLNGWSSIQTQFLNLLAPLKANAASKQKTLQTAAKLAF